MRTARPKSGAFLLDTFAGALVAGAVGALGIAAHPWLTGATTVVESVALFGLLWPFLGFVAASIAVWALVVHGPTRLRLQLVLESSKRRFRLLLTGPSLALGWCVLAYLDFGLFLLLDGRPRLLGALVAASNLGLLLLGSVGLEVGATSLSRRLPRPSLLLASVISVFGGVGGIALAASVGETSGVGGPFALMGVLRRPEIAYRPVFEGLVLFGAAYLGALLAPRALARRTLGSSAAFVGLAACSALLVAARLAPDEAVHLERTKGAAVPVLQIFAAATDRDGDGEPRYFGGADCRDDRADIHPGAVDLPGNGVDEDCSGADATKVATVAPVASPKPSEEKRGPWSVVLLTVDTMRFDLGFSGRASRPGLTPALDALAAKSLVYERAVSLASYTSKSLAPMLIGRYPSETDRTFEHFDRFSPRVPWVQERLQKAGIPTVSVQGYWYFFFKGYGFERGFDVLDASAAPKVVAIEGDKTSNGEKIADRVLAQLEPLAASTKPFFLWAHWVDPHAEYVPHEGFDFGRSQRERYDGEIAFVDQQLGRIFDELERRKLDERTLVIVTSDHGEAFGEHGMIRHGFEVWEELVRVPLVVFVPGATPKRVAVRRSTIDVAPTILDALGISPKFEGADDFVRGRSLLADLDGEPERRPVLVDMPEGPFNKERRAFYSGPHKLITTKGRAIGLYDVDADPDEKNDLPDPALRARLLEEQNAFLGTLSLRPATK